MLDNAREFLEISGMDLPLAVMAAIPEPWTDNATLPRQVRDFYQYYATMMEPWDGPCRGGFAGKNPLANLDKAPEAAMEEFLCLDSIEAFGVTDFAVADSVLWLLSQRPGSEDLLVRYGLNDDS